MRTFLAVNCLMMVGFVHAQTDTSKMFKTSKEVKIVPDSQVKRSIQTFAGLLDSQHVHQFGLASVAELKTLQAGRQFKKYMIGLYDIQNYKQGDDVIGIIKEYPSVEVSLVNSVGKIRTAIEFVKKKDKWIATGYGATPELLILGDAQTKVGDIAFAKGELIRIPSLLITFIAIRSSTGIEFISLEDRPNLNLYKGQKITASDAIMRLVPLAKKHDGLPS